MVIARYCINICNVDLVEYFASDESPAVKLRKFSCIVFREFRTFPGKFPENSRKIPRVFYIEITVYRSKIYVFNDTK